jgi:CDP-4-dehydro-6-deoxyglucose reductase
MGGSHFSVRIIPHGRTVQVAPGQTVLKAALSAGLNLPHSCKSGHCSSCRARVLSGKTHYPRGRPLGLTPEEHDEGYVLLCQAQPESDLTVEARVVASVADVEIKTLPCRIERMNLLAPDVMQVFLRLPSVETLHFQPGQYLDVLLQGGLRRSFSIANPPHDSEFLELHVRRAPGGRFTDELFTRMKPGTLLRIEGPIGQFVYREAEGPLLLIAGGTGFAPIKAILRHVLENGRQRPIHFYWGARRVPDLYEEPLVLEWTKRDPKLTFTAVLSEATEPGAPHRRLGWVHEAVLADVPDLRAFDIYAAGPPAMIEAIRAAFPQERLRFDSFDYAPDALRS